MAMQLSAELAAKTMSSHLPSTFSARFRHSSLAWILANTAAAAALDLNRFHRRLETCSSCQFLPSRRLLALGGLGKVLSIQNSTGRVNSYAYGGGPVHDAGKSSPVAVETFEAGNSHLVPRSVYVHIPFCRRRCFYCDFTVVAVGERTDGVRDHQDAVMSNYVELVCQEIAAAANRRKNTNERALETVFFGGGTPSLLPVALVAKLIDTLKAHFEIAENAEISMEVDPGTFDHEKLEELVDLGISRVSLGVQSFQDHLLKACGRSHGLAEVHDAVDLMRASRLRNWSLDLIASLPNQTLLDWEHSLQQAISAGPAHLSVYDLQIEEGTLFGRWYKAGESPLPSDDNAAEFYRTASSSLRAAGYEHYEVSNYAKPGFQCRHNLVYWENRPYFGFGLGATSYVEGRRFTRPKRMMDYRKYVEGLHSSASKPLENDMSSSKEDLALDTIMLSLRLSRGLDLTTFEATFGSDITRAVCSSLVSHIDLGLVEAWDVDQNVLTADGFAELCRYDTHSMATLSSHGLGLTPTNHNRPVSVRLRDPEGFLVSNEIISSIFAALSKGCV